MQMWVYIVRRLMLLIPILIGVMTITFALVSAIPTQTRLVSYFGSPPPHLVGGYDPTVPCSAIHVNRTGECPNPIYVTLTHRIGLDQPIYIQWADYMYQTFTFHWGYVENDSSVGAEFPIAQHQPVITVLGWFLPYTTELAVISLAIILAISIPIGNIAAANRNRPVDQAARVFSFSGLAIPTYTFGAILIVLVIAVVGASTGYITKTPWCPIGEGTFFELYGSWPQSSCFFNSQFPTWLTYGVISHPTGFPTVDAAVHGQWGLAADTLIRLILPAILVSTGTVAFLLRFVRNSMLEVMNLDYVRTARANGISERVVLRRHAGRNSLNVTVTVLGLTLAGFLGGFPVVELIFHLNGVGLMLADSALPPYDYGMLFGSTILFTYLVVFANLIVDVIYAWLDPRVRLG
jgi:ABC-type dipeptide/oligopeptide/nickel transport system permease component